MRSKSNWDISDSLTSLVNHGHVEVHVLRGLGGPGGLAPGDAPRNGTIATLRGVAGRQHGGLRVSGGELAWNVQLAGFTSRARVAGASLATHPAVATGYFDKRSTASAMFVPPQ